MSDKTIGIIGLILVLAISLSFSLNIGYTYRIKVLENKMADCPSCSQPEDTKTPIVECTNCKHGKTLNSNHRMRVWCGPCNGTGFIRVDVDELPVKLYFDP